MALGKLLSVLCWCFSIFWSGALKVLHNELSKLNFDVVALQETHLESGIQKYEHFTLFNLLATDFFFKF